MCLKKGTKLGRRVPRKMLYCIGCGIPMEVYTSQLEDPQQWYKESPLDGGILFYRCRKCFLKGVRGKPRPWEVCRKISEKKQGVKFSEEHIQNLSKSHVGKSPWNEGIPRSAQTKEKLRIANEGKVLPEETKEQISFSMARRLREIGRENGYNSGYFVSDKFGCKFFYRSSYEKKALEIFEVSNVVSNLESETFILPYEIDDTIRHYVVDYFVKLESGEEVLIEIKPLSMVDLPINILKFQTARDYVEKNDMFFCVLTEKELTNVNSVETTLAEVIQPATAAIL